MHILHACCRVRIKKFIAAKSAVRQTTCQPLTSLHQPIRGPLIMAPHSSLLELARIREWVA
eukprot:46219-Karenia_brevis.AAC.1